MRLGIFTQYVTAATVEDLAERIAAYGLQSAVLDTYPGLAIDWDNPDSQDADRIRRAFERVHVDIAAVGGYLNLAHPDEHARERIYNTLKEMIRFCERVGAPMLCTETGSYNPNGYDWDPSNVTDQALEQVVGWMGPLLEEARSRHVSLGLEPYVMTVTGTTKRLAELIRMIGDQSVRAVFDPAGILSRATLGDQPRFLRESFGWVAPDLGLVHVQDCVPAPRIQDHFIWQKAGSGRVDYPLFMDLLHGHGYDGPLILEFLREDEIPEAMEFVAHQWEQARARKGA